MLATPGSTESLSSVQLQSPPTASPTPYLDRELPLPGPNWGYRPIKPWQTAIVIAVFLLRTPFEIYLLILGVTLVHELGHCLAGLLAGLEFDRIRVGPLELDPYKRLTWQWNRGTILGGHALMLPRSESKLRVRFTAYIAGGPIANITCGVALLNVMPTGNSHFVGLVQLFVAGSFLVGIGNLIPLRRYGVSSDGRKLVMLLLNKSERWIFLLRRQAATKHGEAFEEEIDPVSAGRRDGSSDYVGANWAAYTVADGKGDYDQAARHLDACLEKCYTVEPTFREELILAAGRFQAMRRRRTEIAWQWLKSANNRKSKISYPYTEALILFSEGKIEDAQAKAGEVSDLVSRLPSGRIKKLQENAARQLTQIVGTNTKATPTTSNIEQTPNQPA